MDVAVAFNALEGSRGLEVALLSAKTRSRAKSGASLSASPCITAALRAASRRMTMLYDELMSPSGLRVTQYYILSELERSTREPPTVGELSEILTIERSALGQTLRPLERDGFIKFGRDPQDRRRRPILLTSMGRKAVARARPFWTEAHQRFERFYGTAPMADLRTALRAIAEDPALSDAFDRGAPWADQAQHTGDQS